ncbi:DNA-binding protein [Terasakiella sp.]|uniref:DNA-binding protein n=1 Tax=Terasakiella sp. TaxID=2034861 RepID=UPI003AA7C2DD
MLTLLGMCDGVFVKTKEVRGRDGSNVQIKEHYVLIQVEEQNQYDRVEVKTREVRMAKKHIDSGIDRLYDALKGKPVAVPVYVQAWASRAGNAGFDLWLSGDGKNANVQLIPAEK